MVKKANLHPYLTSDELKSRYLSSSDRVESVEKHLLWLVSKSWTIQQAAQAVGLNYDYAKEILKGYNQQGEQANANRRRQRTQPPSHALLNGEQLEQLRSSLKQPPPDKGLWTGRKVADWIARKTGREKVWSLHRMGLPEKMPLFSSKTTTASHESRFNSAARVLKKLHQTVRELQGKFPNAVIEVWSFDEHRVGLKPILRRVWAPFLRKTDSERLSPL